MARLYWRLQPSWLSMQGSHTQNDRKIWKIEGPDVVRDMSVGFLLRGKSRTKRAPLNSFAQRQQTNTMAQGMCVT